MSLATKILFCNALPCSEESFNQEVLHPTRDFIRFFRQDRARKNRTGDWQSYSEQLIQPYITLKNAFTSYGFEFIDECTLKTFRHKVANISYEAVILFSHCILNGEVNESIEFFDAMALSSDIIQLIPEQPPRIYDFSVCCSTYLKQMGDLLKGAHVFGTSDKTIPLSLWLVIYAETFSNMVIHKKDFIDAFDMAILSSKKKSKKTL